MKKTSAALTSSHAVDPVSYVPARCAGVGVAAGKAAVAEATGVDSVAVAAVGGSCAKLFPASRDRASPKTTDVNNFHVISNSSFVNEA